MKNNPFYSDLKEVHGCCFKEGGEYEGHETIKDMHTYRNSNAGALDYVHYGDQVQDNKLYGGYAADNENSFENDVKLDDPELTPEAKREMNSIETFAKFLGEDVVELDVEDILEEYEYGDINENISQFDMFMDSVFLSIADSYESKPNLWRSTKRIAERMDKEAFSKIIERKVKDETLAEAFMSIHRVLISENY